MKKILLVLVLLLMAVSCSHDKKNKPVNPNTQDTVKYTLLVNISGKGTIASKPAGIQCGETCSFKFNDQDQVELIPSPGDGYVFSRWQGDEDCTDGLVTLSADKQCTAVFDPIPAGQFTLTINLTGGNGTVTSKPVGIDCGETCSFAFDDQTVIELTATPGADQQFSQWQGDDDCLDGQVTMSTDKQCTAVFAPVVPQFTLTINITGNGVGTVTSNPAGLDCGRQCVLQQPAGTNLVLKATPGGAQHSFTGWQGENCAENITLNSDMTCQAEFTYNPPDPVPIACTEKSSPFTWIYPPPAGYHYEGVWGVSADNYVAVGLRGGIVCRQNGNWVIADSGVVSDLYAVWGANGNDIFAVGGQGTILHFDGQNWISMPSNSGNSLFYSMHGFAGDNVYAVGSHFVHFDGTSWELIQTPRPFFATSIWGSDPRNVFVVGGDSVYFFDGFELTEQFTKPSAPNTNFGAVWGTSAQNVFAAGGNGIIYHFDGESWSQMEAGLGSSSSILDLAGFGANDVYGMDLNGRYRHFDGNTWSDPISSGMGGMYDLFAVPGGPILGVGINRISSFDGVTWSEENSISVPNYAHLRDTWASGMDDVFIAGRYGVYHYDGQVFEEMNMAGVNLNGIWGFQTGEVFTVGSAGKVWRYQTQIWSEMDSTVTETLNGIWGLSANELYAVGGGGKILFYNGQMWQSMTSNTVENLNGIWGSASNDIYAVGDNAVIMHYNGQTWAAVTGFNGNGHILSISGSAANNIYVVTTLGEVYHFNGDTWQQELDNGKPFNANGPIYDVWVTPSGWVMFTGAVATYYYNGAQWTETDQANAQYFRGVWATESGGVLQAYLAGDNSRFVKFNSQ